MAKAIAFNLRKLTTRYGLSIVMACSDDDIERDLQPDVTFNLRGRGQYVRVERKPRKRSISFSRRLVIEEGRKRDYDGFAEMHYRSTDGQIDWYECDECGSTYDSKWTRGSEEETAL